MFVKVKTQLDRREDLAADGGQAIGMHRLACTRAGIGRDFTYELLKKISKPGPVDFVFSSFADARRPKLN